MTLDQLMAAIATAGEHACEAARQRYHEHVERRAGREADLPGSPTLLGTTPPGTLFPSRLEMDFPLSILADGDKIMAELEPIGEPPQDPGKSRWFHRRSQARKGAPARLKVEWEAHDVPEGVARIQEHHDLANDAKLREHYRPKLNNEPEDE